MFTLVLRCYYVVIFAKCVRLFPCGRLRSMWYRTMTAILLRRERGRNNAEMYAVLVVTPPPPPLQREVTFQKGGRNDARVRYMTQCTQKIKTDKKVGQWAGKAG